MTTKLEGKYFTTSFNGGFRRIFNDILTMRPDLSNPSKVAEHAVRELYRQLKQEYKEDLKYSKKAGGLGPPGDTEVTEFDTSFSKPTNICFGQDLPLQAL